LGILFWCPHKNVLVFQCLNYVIYLLFWFLLLKEIYEWDFDIFSYIFLYFKYLLIYLFNLATKLPNSIFIFIFIKKTEHLRLLREVAIPFKLNESANFATVRRVTNVHLLLLVRLFYEGSQKTLATPTSAPVGEQSQLYICDPSNSRNQSF